MIHPTDRPLIELLREHGQMSVLELANRLEITATAVRAKLSRLMEADLVGRQAVTEGRGRPSHRYAVTEEGRRQSGANFADLALALWEEVRAIPDPETRRGLLQRLAKRMAESYSVAGKTAEERMKSVAALFGERRVPFAVDRVDGLPVLNAKCCPYPSLAEKDRGICAMERMMFSEMVGEKLQLSNCRLDGDTCCTFEISVG